MIQLKGQVLGREWGNVNFIRHASFLKDNETSTEDIPPVELSNETLIVEPTESNIFNKTAMQYLTQREIQVNDQSEEVQPA